MLMDEKRRLDLSVEATAEIFNSLENVLSELEKLRDKLGKILTELNYPYS